MALVAQKMETDGVGIKRIALFLCAFAWVPFAVFA
jgi:hypothetical protein